ncbi:hypothetical protein GCM10027406_12680 [Leifsonia lichenia]
MDGAAAVGAALDGAALDGAALDGAALDGAALDGAVMDVAATVGAATDARTFDGAPGAEDRTEVPPHSRRVRLGVGAAVVLLLGALVVAIVVSALGQRGATAIVAPVSTSVPSLAPAAAAVASAASGRDVVLVHILGAVSVPGLVSLASGARVMDAIAAAGGLADDADLSSVNLARPVSDGEQLSVPRVGEAVPPPAASGTTGASGSVAAPSGTVNLNTATQADLETLPRIGPTLAARILDWRTANGRFAAPTDLLAVTGIGQRLFDGVKDLVTV